ncbi:MAG: glycosyltransferase [Candidatus Coatesbacteria bacterium]|nr:MAG: glycosyltransferase [Candidatus Coatesbacteria bacterium]
MDVVLFSTQYFEEPTWTNKQHIAVRLAAAGHRVIYVDPAAPISPRKYSLPGHLARALRGDLPGNRFLSFTHVARKNLWVVTPPFLVPRRSRVVRRLNRRITTRGVLRHLSRLMRRLRFGKPVLWIYRPEAVWFAGRLNEELVFYDCVDDYVDYPIYPLDEDNERIRRDEAELLARADLVATSSRHLYERKSPANPNTHYVPNVADAAHFARTAETAVHEPPDVAGLPKPRIGFAGAVESYKLDMALLSATADERPDWQVVLIGPAESGDPDLDALAVKPNVHLIGPRPYAELPDYLAAMDALVIPYRLNDYTRGVFPIKFFEYLATGKSVVCTGLPALAEFGETVPLVSDPSAFVEAVEAALAGEQDGKRRARIDIAFENTWEKRIGELLGLIDETLNR